MEGQTRSCQSSSTVRNPQECNLHACTTRCAHMKPHPLTILTGRLVYSTCSMNPIEDEAVVLAGLQSDPGVRLIPARGLLQDAVPPAFANCLLPGLTTWWVPSVGFSAENPTWATLESCSDDQILRSMFPDAVDEAVTQSLSQCVRVLPITTTSSCAPCGGFFMALFERIAPCSPNIAIPQPVTSIRPGLQRLEERNSDLLRLLQDMFGLQFDQHPQQLGLFTSRATGPVDVVVLAPSEPVLHWPVTQNPIGQGVPAFVSMSPRCSHWPNGCSRWRLCQPAAGSMLECLQVHTEL